MDRSIHIIKQIGYCYTPLFVRSLVYMLQATEYKVNEYIAWVARTKNFYAVEQRRTLIWTTKAIALYGVGIVIYIGTVFGAYIVTKSSVVAGILLIGCLPVVLAVSLAVIAAVGYYGIQAPKEKKLFAQTKSIIESHPGKKIAILGSYGKTTFKESLTTILHEGLHVAASPGNMNTPIGISRFVKKLDGTEDVLIFEFGEEKAGDIHKLAKLASPDIAIITGISPAHLSSFGNMETLIDTIYEIDDISSIKQLYVNKESDHVHERKTKHTPKMYDRKGCGTWKINEVKMSLDGTKFQIQNGKKVVWAKTGMIGEHLIGPLAACVDIAHTLHMNIAEISEGIGKTKAYEHRMQPRHLHGATIIDDTYNGNLSGVKAGLKFLSSVEAKHKMYVTPGLVEQGEDSAQIHHEVGECIAQAAIDTVVLMKNSTTQAILDGLRDNNFTGNVLIEDDPLHFYKNLEHKIAKGDVVLMQNDWTDNYS